MFIAKATGPSTMVVNYASSSIIYNCNMFIAMTTGSAVVIVNFDDAECRLGPLNIFEQG
jgi:hypothetical protein